MAFTNCTERPIPRPIDKRRKAYYSGKKKKKKITTKFILKREYG